MLRLTQHASLGDRRIVGDMSIRLFYDQWAQYNLRMVEVIGAMSDEHLTVRPAAGRWPIWATVGHTAGARVYWLCAVLGEPGVEDTPFTDPSGAGWEDDLNTPRGADQLVAALQTTWGVVDGCLDRWTPEMLTDTFTREYGDVRRIHTRGSVLQRLFSHDAYHCGELSQTLGVFELPQIDLWRSG